MTLTPAQIGVEPAGRGSGSLTTVAKARSSMNTRSDRVEQVRAERALGVAEVGHAPTTFASSTSCDGSWSARLPRRWRRN